MTDTADTETRREDRIPVDLNQPIALSVHMFHGDVTVRAAERTDMLIAHHTPGLPRDRDDEAELSIEARNNRIEVRARSRTGSGWAGITGDVDLDGVVGQITRAFRRGGLWSSAEPDKVRSVSGRHEVSDITIEVPQAITGRVEIHSASGDVQIEGVTSEIALNTMSGDVRVLRTSGGLTLQTASGDLVVEGASGRLTALTASGDVRVTSAEIDGFDIQTANGDILVDAMLTGEGTSRAQTANGDVRLTLRRPTAGADEPAATLSFHTVSGDAHVTQPFRKTDRRSWQAGAGDGGPHIDVTTVNGDLTAEIAAVESAFALASPMNDAPSAPPSPHAPPAPPALVIAPAQPSPPTEPAQSIAQEETARLAVLEAVERGELDVEEALRRLEAADSSPTS